MYIAILFGLVILIYFTFPETKNLTIEEIAIVFDGDRAMRIVEASQGEQGVLQKEFDGTEKNAAVTEHVTLSN